MNCPLHSSNTFANVAHASVRAWEFWGGHVDENPDGFREFYIIALCE